QNLIRVDGGAGGVDESWLPDIDGSVRNLAVDGEGRVYLVGSNLTVSGQNLGNLLRLHPVTGLPDPGWTPAVASSASGLLLTDDGFAYTTYSPDGVHRLLRHPI